MFFERYGRQKKERCMLTTRQWDTRLYFDVNLMLNERLERWMDVKTTLYAYWEPDVNIKLRIA